MESNLPGAGTNLIDLLTFKQDVLSGVFMYTDSEEGRRHPFVPFAEAALLRDRFRSFSLGFGF